VSAVIRICIISGNVKMPRVLPKKLNQYCSSLLRILVSTWVWMGCMYSASTLYATKVLHFHIARFYTFSRGRWHGVHCIQFYAHFDDLPLGIPLGWPHFYVASHFGLCCELLITYCYYSTFGLPTRSHFSFEFQRVRQTRNIRDALKILSCYWETHEGSASTRPTPLQGDQPNWGRTKITCCNYS